ncbi:MAG: hypothetical protein HKN47_27655, partial [Pirellulaceae bacterium]|nr:hypothetical protein [Pirellulaceae bacterium]
MNLFAKQPCAQTIVTVALVVVLLSAVGCEQDQRLSSPVSDASGRSRAESVSSAKPILSHVPTVTQIKNAAIRSDVPRDPPPLIPVNPRYRDRVDTLKPETVTDELRVLLEQMAPDTDRINEQLTTCIQSRCETFPELSAGLAEPWDAPLFAPDRGVGTNGRRTGFNTHELVQG